MENFNRCILALVTVLCTLDCLTTTIGYLLGAAEYNPIMAFLLNVSIFVFVFVKVGTVGTVCWGFSFTKKVIVKMEQAEPHHIQTKMLKYLWAGFLYSLAGIMMFTFVNNVTLLFILT